MRSYGDINDMSALIQLIYASSAVQLFTEQHLIALLDKSRENNRRRNITGMLLYRDGNFLQVLEGEAAQVDALYKIIAADPRHKSVMLISRREVHDRIFPEWEMGFNNVTEADMKNYPGFTEFLRTPFTPEYLAAHPSRARVFLETFRENTQRY